jgi:putative transposase
VALIALVHGEIAREWKLLGITGPTLQRALSASERRPAMRGKRFTEQQIAEILRELDAAVKVADLSRKHNVSVATIYSWKAKLGRPEASDVQRLKQMEEENRRLKQLVAELSLDREALKQLIRKGGGHSSL